MSRLTFLVGATTAIAVGASAHAQTYSSTGPSSSATPYVVPVPGTPVSLIRSIITVGDEVGGYPFLGIPDGMGGFLTSGTTMALFVNHELTATASGYRHAHQPKGFAGGAFISRWDLDIRPGADFLKAIDGRDAMLSVATVTNGTGGSLYNFARFCSGDVPEVRALYNAATGKGTQHRFYFTGEESGCGGRMTVTDLDTGIVYQMVGFDSTPGSWENGLARPFESDQTVVLGTSDGCDNRIFLYVGEKSDVGNPAERAGLLNGISAGIQVRVGGVDVPAESREFCFGTSSPVYSGEFVLAPASTNAGTKFLRPEDAAWDPANPTDAYVVCTDRMNSATQLGSSRLFRLRFNDVNNPAAGGTIEALLDGTDVMEMGDNLCVYNDIQGGTRVILQEDPGNNAHNAKTLLYTVATDALEVIMMSDPARFGDGPIPPTAPFSRDEENSGVFHAVDSLGTGWFIGNMQAHYALANPYVEGGQLYAFYCPECVGSCRADVAQPLDGTVGPADLTVLLAAWGQSGPTDLNADGNTDGQDLTILLSSWGACQ